jgi:hypothetical protein
MQTNKSNLSFGTLWISASTGNKLGEKALKIASKIGTLENVGCSGKSTTFMYSIKGPKTLEDKVATALREKGLVVDNPMRPENYPTEEQVNEVIKELNMLA